MSIADAAERVFVFRYLFWDEASQSRRVSSVLATEEAIRGGLGVRIDGGSMMVLRSALRDDGVYVLPAPRK